MFFEIFLKDMSLILTFKTLNAVKLQMVIFTLDLAGKSAVFLS